MTTTLRVRSREVLTAVQWMQHGDHVRIEALLEPVDSHCKDCGCLWGSHGSVKYTFVLICPNAWVVFDDGDRCIGQFKTRADLDAAYETVSEEET